MTPLQLDNARLGMRKISINVLHKDPNATLFTVPLEEGELTREQLNAYLGVGTFESWYNHDPDGVWRPMPWWEHLPNGELPIDDEFVCEGAIISLANGTHVEFEAEEIEDEDGESTKAPAARITTIVFKATSGGQTKLKFHMQVRPGLSQNNLALQENQFSSVRVTLSDVKPRERKGRQQDLPLQASQGEQAQASGPTTDPAAGGDPGVQTSAQSDLELRRESVTEEQDAALDRTIARPPAFKSADEAANERTHRDAPADDAAAFEEGLGGEIQKFEARPNGVIDGRSERVKHQDEQRAKANGEAA